MVEIEHAQTSLLALLVIEVSVKRILRQGDDLPFRLQIAVGNDGLANLLADGRLAGGRGEKLVKICKNHATAAYFSASCASRDTNHERPLALHLGVQGRPRSGGLSSLEIAQCHDVVSSMVFLKLGKIEAAEL